MATTAAADAAPSRPAGPPAVRRIVVTSLANSGRGSLRAAIRAANAGTSRPGRRSVITFGVAGVIRLRRGLPVIFNPVTIDGLSAPKHHGGGPPVVEIDCSGHAGLVFGPGSAGSALLGIAVDGAKGAGVAGYSNALTVDDDYIGLDLAGAALGNHGAGIYLAPVSSGDRIGLNSSGDAGVVANVISGNAGSGIVLAGSSGDSVAANRIGTNPAGTAAIANGGNGIWITGRASGNEIGGTDFVDAATGQANDPTGDKGTVPPVFVVPPLGNLISGNSGDGVRIDARSVFNVLNGNFIGTTASGDQPLGNSGNGVWIHDANRNSLIGCKFVNNPFVYYNVVSGNGQNGLRITDADHTVVQGNFFGIGANNTNIVANRRDGIRVDGSSASTQIGGVIPLGNVSAGNGRDGIDVAGTARGFVTFNTFGGLLAFKGAAANGGDGLLITSTGGDNLARTNVFSGNRRNGIELAGDASGVTVDPDIVGLTTKGNAALPNGGDGLLIDGSAHGNVIGGSRRSVIPQNTFSGNAGYGIAITGRAHRNVVFGGFIGTEVLGVSAIANLRGGILIGGRAYRNTVGQPRRRRSNLVSGNAGNGVTLGFFSHDNRVINNYIGLNRFGRPLRNTGRPIVNRGIRNVIRGNRT